MKLIDRYEFRGCIMEKQSEEESHSDDEIEAELSYMEQMAIFESDQAFIDADLSLDSDEIN